MSEQLLNEVLTFEARITASKSIVSKCSVHPAAPLSGGTDYPSHLFQISPRGSPVGLFTTTPCGSHGHDRLLNYRAEPSMRVDTVGGCCC